MPIEHKVKQGEDISGIANRYGLLPDTIWNDAANKELKDKRKDPNILYPGDVVVIPEKSAREENGGTEQRHSFRTKGKARYLKIVMQNPQGKPLAHRPYVLQINGSLLEDPNGLGNETDADGVIECCIPHNATEVKLIIDDDTWNLTLSHLDPIDTVEGLQERLNNLNYPVGPVDGIEGPRTREAVRNFQRDYGLKVDGLYGPKSQEKLRQVHGC